MERGVKGSLTLRLEGAEEGRGLRGWGRGDQKVILAHRGHARKAGDGLVDRGGEMSPMPRLKGAGEGRGVVLGEVIAQ